MAPIWIHFSWNGSELMTICTFRFDSFTESWGSAILLFIYLFIFFLKWFLGRFSHCFVYLLIYFFWHFFFFVQVFWDRFWRFSETSPGSFQQFFDNFEQFIDSSWTVSVQFRIVCDVSSQHLCFDVPRSKFGKLINRF